MKKTVLLSSMILVLIMTFSSNVHASPVYARELEIKEDKTIVLKEEKEIKEHLKSKNFAYDPNIVEIIIIENEDLNFTLADDKFDIQTRSFGNDYYHKNLKTREITDKNSVIDSSKFPAGKVTYKFEKKISDKIKASAGVSNKVVCSTVGFEYSTSRSFSKSWSNTYGYPTNIKVHPRYKEYSYDLWEKDIWFDDYIGPCKVWRAIGIEIIVYR